MVARTEEMADARSLDARIDRMHQGDRRGALAFVIGLWLTMLFALSEVSGSLSFDSTHRSLPFDVAPPAETNCCFAPMQRTVNFG